jgi:hypothetical protein
MWQSNYEKIFPGLDRQAVWAAWADVNSWPQWDEELELTSLAGPFEEGAQFVLKPKGGPKVTIQIVFMKPHFAFTDVARFSMAKMYDIHEMEETPEGLKLKSSIRVEGWLGWLWKKIVAQGVAEGVPKQMEALASFVQAKQRKTSFDHAQK